VSFLLHEGESPGAGLARAMRGQADKMLAECETAKDNPGGFAHKARVRAKKIRAALRLAKPMLGAKAWRKENRWWRNAARKLAELRDAGARLEALDSLRPFLIARIGSAMTRKLSERFEKEQRGADAETAIDSFCKYVDKRGSKLIPRLRAGSRKDLADAVAEGYRASRRAMKPALATAEPEFIHEWRKQSKYHALQARLVRQKFPDALEERHIVARDLAELLGAVQDIEVVFEGIADWAEGPENLVEALQARRVELLEEARVAGEALFGDKTKAWAKLLARRKRKARKAAAPAKRATTAPRRRKRPTTAKAAVPAKPKAAAATATSPQPPVVPPESPSPASRLELEPPAGNA
jgi:hypothetical protein